MKKLKIHDANVANGFVVYMEEALKKKLEGFEDQGKASKLSKLEVKMAKCWRKATLPPTIHIRVHDVEAIPTTEVRLATMIGQKMENLSTPAIKAKQPIIMEALWKK
ncbi:hypothetical protein M9H77_31152 [Catharanthus roseus]|uniref:Uncharacterized protein n=1 Tax=Catharanthus roseus TaxID=4058 RepID=A0ACB9ZZ89_CATRO|nr:hypothetical protein M9H77_31152 [Catharanthus roseus]